MTAEKKEFESEVKGKKNKDNKEEGKEKEKKKPIELEDSDYSALSPLLDFYSDRAVAHASFLVACVFGLVTFLSLLRDANQNLKTVYSIGYLTLLVGGYYSLCNFRFFASKAQKIKATIENDNRALVDKIFEEDKAKKPNVFEVIVSIMRRPYTFIREKIPTAIKFIAMFAAYLVVGVLPWLYTVGILH